MMIVQRVRPSCRARRRGRFVVLEAGQEYLFRWCATMGRGMHWAETVQLAVRGDVDVYY